MQDAITIKLQQFTVSLWKQLRMISCSVVQKSDYCEARGLFVE